MAQPSTQLENALHHQRNGDYARAIAAYLDLLSNAPPHVIQQQRDRLAKQQERRARLEARLGALQG